MHWSGGRVTFSAELNLAQAQRNELLALIKLYKALGGGWQNQSDWVCWVMRIKGQPMKNGGRVLSGYVLSIKGERGCDGGTSVAAIWLRGQEITLIGRNLSVSPSLR